ncbi:MAG: hypothetical protein AAB886_01780, partial [Patescibacteria group bacterium]
YLFLALAGLFAALVSGCETVYSTVFEGDSTVVNNYGDDDSASAEEPTPEPADDDSAVEPTPVPTQAFVYWDGEGNWPSVDVTQQPAGGTPVVFGRWGITVFGEPGTVVSVNSMAFVGYISSEDWEDGYQAGEHGGLAVSDIIGNCEVFNGYNGQPVWAARSVEQNGVAIFGEGKPFAVEVGTDGEGWGLLTLRCYGLNPSGMLSGEEASVLFNLDSGANLAMADQNGDVVGVELLSDNRNPVLEGNSWQFPRSAAYFYAPDIEPYAWVTQHAATPNGLAVPGIIGVLTFNVSAEVADLEVHGLNMMLVTSDNGVSGWNTCDELGDGIDGEGGIQLYEVSNMETSMGLFGAYSPAGTCANPAGGGWVVGGATNNWWSWVIPAGTSATFAITAETTGASSVLDDQIQVTIASLTVSDATTGATVPVVGLPLVGGTLVF